MYLKVIKRMNELSAAYLEYPEIRESVSFQNDFRRAAGEYLEFVKGKARLSEFLIVSQFIQTGKELFNKPLEEIAKIAPAPAPQTNPVKE